MTETHNVLFYLRNDAMKFKSEGRTDMAEAIELVIRRLETQLRGALIGVMVSRGKLNVELAKEIVDECLL